MKKLRCSFMRELNINRGKHRLTFTYYFCRMRLSFLFKRTLTVVRWLEPRSAVWDEEEF